MRKQLLVACLFVMLGCSTTASADPITLTFDEAPPGTVPVTNPPAANPFLSFRGVTFEFRVGGLLSADARYGAIGPGNFTVIQGRVLEGDAAGVLTLNFPVTMLRLQFGVALTSPNNLSPGLTVELFDAALQSLGVNAVNTSRLSTLPLSEGTFSYVGAPISRAVLNFNEGALGSTRRFALDNLTFEPVPEPATLVLFGTGLAGAARVVRKRRSGR